MDPNLALIDKLQNRIMILTDEIRTLEAKLFEAAVEIARLTARVEELTSDNELLETLAWEGEKPNGNT